jgi:hypothetical protein
VWSSIFSKEAIKDTKGRIARAGRGLKAADNGGEFAEVSLIGQARETQSSICFREVYKMGRKGSWAPEHKADELGEDSVVVLLA